MKNAINIRKTLVSILVIFSLLMTCLLNTYAVNNDKLVLELKAGSASAKINGTATKLEKPYILNKTFMVPLEWFTTAIGAEVIKKSDKIIEIIYWEKNLELTVGATDYISNLEKKKLPVAPVIKNESTMVPLEFISSNFPVTVTSDLKKGTIKIVLEDDGALSDLSFLTGGITSPKVGNSYFGWSLSIPSGSRIISNSFKSDKVGITNESRSLYFEIAVEDKKGRNLQELYNTIVYSSTVRSAEIDLRATVPYFQYTRLTEFDESLLVKVFDKGDYFYYFTINSYDNSVTPEKLLTDKYYQNIVNSFSLNYKGAVIGVEDVSKIRQGKASFYNYLVLSLNTKYLPWSVDVPATWDKLLSNDDPMETCLGLDSTHYMKITMNSLKDEEALDEYVDKIAEKYKNNFNPKVYNFISDDYTTAAGNVARSLKFRIKQANKSYIMEELYFTKGPFVYEITVKLPESDHDKYINEFIETINHMNFYLFNEEALISDIEKYNNKNLGVRVSQKDDLFEYINKNFNWSIKLPGFWTKAGNDDDSSVTFTNPNSNSNVIVYSIENSSILKSLSDEEKFGIMRTLKKVYETTPVQTAVTEKGYQMRVYTYKVESVDLDFFSEVKCYCFEVGNYSYCFLTSVPELTATDKALKEVEDIWKSFTISKK